VVSEKAWFAREFWPYLTGIFLMLLINAASADIMWFSFLTTLHFFLFGVLATSLLEDGPITAPARAGPAPSLPPPGPPPEPAPEPTPIPMPTTPRPRGLSPR
jgi:hypothetical protein